MAAKEARGLCAFCREPADPRYREVTGWEQLRTAGGANKIIARRPTGRLICDRCMGHVRAGLDPASALQLPGF